MDDPIDLPVPSDPIEKVHALARDIAFGSMKQEKFTPHLRVKNANDQVEFIDGGLNNYLSPKWGNTHNYYAVHRLVLFGYLAKSSVDTQEEGTSFYDVTPKAIALLDKPITPAKIFISYKQSESSALALLIESRLK